MQKFSSKLLPIIVLFYLISINQIDCRGRSNRGPPKRGTPHRGPNHRGPPKCGPAHRDAPRRPPPNRCHKNYENQTVIDTTFVYESGTVKVGDHLQCKLVNVTLAKKSSRCNTHVFTQPGNGPDALTFLPVSNNSKCFSFQVRLTNGQIHTHFSETPYYNNNSNFEVVISDSGVTEIRDKNYDIIKSAPTPIDITNTQNLHPFWVRYDNNLVEVGYGNNTVPYLSHKFLSTDGLPSPVNYIGIVTVTNSGEWIIDDPVCGTKNSTATPTPTQHQVKTVCKVKPKVK